MVSITCPQDFIFFNFELNLGIDISSIQVNITLEWLSDDLVDGKSTLVLAMAW